MQNLSGGFYDMAESKVMLFEADEKILKGLRGARESKQIKRIK